MEPETSQLLIHFGPWQPPRFGPFQSNSVRFSTPNMTGRRFHNTTEVIPRRAWKSKSPLLPDLVEPAKTQGRKGCARGTTRYILHSLPLYSPPVVQSYLSPEFRVASKFWRVFGVRGWGRGWSWGEGVLQGKRKSRQYQGKKALVHATAGKSCVKGCMLARQAISTSHISELRACDVQSTTYGRNMQKTREGFRELFGGSQGKLRENRRKKHTLPSPKENLLENPIKTRKPYLPPKSFPCGLHMFRQREKFLTGAERSMLSFSQN